MNDTEKENKSDEDSESLEEEEVDPRVQVGTEQQKSFRLILIHLRIHIKRINETRLNTTYAV